MSLLDATSRSLLDVTLMSLPLRFNRFIVKDVINVPLFTGHRWINAVPEFVSRLDKDPSDSHAVGLRRQISPGTAPGSTPSPRNCASLNCSTCVLATTRAFFSWESLSEHLDQSNLVSLANSPETLSGAV